MKKFLVVIILSAVAIFATGCSQTLADKVQQENLITLNASWEYIYGKLIGRVDDPATPEDESKAPEIPHNDMLESHGDLLREAMELELAKRKTWQDMAGENGWEEK